MLVSLLGLWVIQVLGASSCAICHSDSRWLGSPNLHILSGYGVNFDLVWVSRIMLLVL